MKWRLLEGVKRYAGRDIVRVMLDDGTVQPFYRSSGRNSGRPGVWFPFDGLWPYCYPLQGWFNKKRYHRGYHPMDRLGTSFYKSISDALFIMNKDIEGEEVIRNRAGLDSINEWLGLSIEPAMDCKAA